MEKKLGRGNVGSWRGMSSRTVDSDADEASEHADEAGPRIARRIWGPVTKDVSESIGAPAAVAVQL